MIKKKSSSGFYHSLEYLIHDLMVYLLLEHNDSKPTKPWVVTQINDEIDISSHGLDSHRLGLSQGRIMGT